MKMNVNNNRCLSFSHTFYLLFLSIGTLLSLCFFSCEKVNDCQCKDYQGKERDKGVNTYVWDYPIESKEECDVIYSKRNKVYWNNNTQMYHWTNCEAIYKD
jgi:hypothetical protein